MKQNSNEFNKSEFTEEEFKQHNKAIEDSWSDAKKIVSCDINEIDKLDNQRFDLRDDK